MIMNQEAKKLSLRFLNFDLHGSHYIKIIGWVFRLKKAATSLFKSLGGILLGDVCQALRSWNFLISIGTTKLCNSNYLQVKLFLPLLGLLRAVSQITAQRGLSTTGSRQRTTLRQVHRECHSILQHHRYSLKVVFGWLPSQWL